MSGTSGTAQDGGGDTAPPPKIHWRPLRAVRVLRVILLVILAGFGLAVILSYGRKGKPQTDITMAPTSPTPAAQGAVVDRSDEFEVNGTREGRPAFTLRARSVTGFAGDRKFLRGVDLIIHDDRGGTVKVSGLEGQFDVTERRARLTGDVTVENDSEGLTLKTGTLFYDNDRDMIFTADDIQFGVGTLAGQGRGMNYLISARQIKIPDRVVLRIEEPGALPATVTSGDLVAALEDDTAVFTDNVRLERGGDVLFANYLKAQFAEGHKTVRQLNAFGDVILTRASAPGGRPQEMRGDALSAQFSGPRADLKAVDLSGSVRMTSGDMTSLSRSARYRAADGRVELRGDPVVRNATDRIAAQEIDVEVGPKILEARGDVRTVSLPSSAAGGPGAAPGFGSRAAVSFQARTLVYDQTAQKATYTGSARAWQEGNSIQAEEIVLDQAARQLRAKDNVMGRFTQRRAGTAAAAARPVVTAITAGSLVFDDREGVGRYRDNVRLTRESAAVTSEAMDAYLVDRAGTRELDRIEAEGGVAVKHEQAFGTSRSAEYRAADDTLIMKDDAGLAEVVDAATGRTLRGKTLTFDLAGDRILTEPARGARTWITLKPEAKDVQSVEPQTKY